MIRPLVILVAVLYLSSCKNPSNDKESHSISQTDTMSVPAAEPVEQEQPQVQGRQISADSLAYFEDLGVDDDKRRSDAVQKVNGVFKVYQKNLPNQASYSAMKFYETFTKQFLENVNSVDKNTREVWSYYIAAELILRAPEDEIKNATETLARVESANSDFSSKDMTSLKKFNAEVMAELKRIM
jgi:hypothetical protein